MEFESFDGNKGPFIFSQVGLGGWWNFKGDYAKLDGSKGGRWMRGSHQRNPLKFCSDGICNDAMQKLTLMTIRKFRFSRVSIPPNPSTFL